MSERQGRDITDPESLGLLLETLRKQNPTMKLHEVADMVADSVEVKSYVDDRTFHSVKYMQELKQRAVDGDKYAISALARMNGDAAPNP